MTFDEYYFDLVYDILTTGDLSSNRTGIDTLFKNGLYMEFDMEEGFPLLTTKKVPWKSAFGEMLGFIRGYTSAADFRKLGCNVWNSNANENKEWLNNPNRTGVDDLQRIYGYRWRTWENILVKDGKYIHTHTDQLKDVYTKLLNNIDDRRLIVEGWHPAELDMQALPVCHKSLQFSLRKNKTILDLFIYVRSNDVGLGMPFNVAQYAWLLHLMAKITNHIPGKLLYFAMNYHIYTNHIEPLKEQLTRKWKETPLLILDDCVTDLNFLETTELPIDSWSHIENYDPWPNIKMEMAV
jgi:thymidylate synthase